MSSSRPGLHLRLELTPPDADPPAGAPLSARGGLVAGLSLREDAASVAIRLVDRPVAELRWLVDGVVRGVRSALTLNGAARLRVAEGVSGDVARAVALDLARRFGDRLEHGLGEDVDAVARSEALYRRWVNEDPTVRTSTAIAADARAWVDAVRGDLPVNVDVLDRAACEEAGLRLLLAVGGASRVSPPTLVIARYDPPGATLAPWMLVGKGITFDTGGINVKPYESFVSMMKNDMAGAALAWALFTHLAEARHPRPLVCVLPACENPVGEDAMRPGALVKAHNGLTVRIDHTDAEGRLILADALSYATERHPVERVITFATLTTAALIAYGPHATPVHFAPPSLEAALAGASAITGEDLHFFPERIWHREANRDEEADVKNTGRLPGRAARGAGSRNAAHFLTFFTERPLTHLDIFASTWSWSGDAPGVGYGATGAPFRAVVRALADHDAG